MKAFARTISFVILYCLFVVTRAQYVTIPDTAFINWLNTNGYSSCLNGNQMDTTCNAVTSAKSVHAYFSGLTDIEGIQYFDSLTFLDCSANLITHLPPFPPLLKTAYIQDNDLITIPSLPSTLVLLNCQSCKLTSLPTIPPGVRSIYAPQNQLTGLPVLPDSLEILNVRSNNITSIATIPSLLTELYISSNPNTTLGPLPQGLLVFDAGYVFTSNFPAVPTSVIELKCGGNNLSSLQTLPPGLVKLDCENNSLGTLPSLPASLTRLVCYSNQLTSLPALPARLRTLQCDRNKLTEIPELPDTLDYFYCGTNRNLACLPGLGVIDNFNFSSTAITCLPNYPVCNVSTPLYSSLPICDTAIGAKCSLSTNIDAINKPKAEFTYYPNPANNQVTIITAMPNQVLQIFDVEGRIVFTQTITGTATTINLTNIASGVYVVGLNNTSVRKRLVKL